MRSSFGDFVTGILVGSAIGYVIALLNAPRPGDETRQMWTDKGREMRDRAMDTVQSTVDKTGKLVSDSRERLGSTVETTRNRMQDRVSDLKDRSGGVVSDVREQVSDKLRSAADQVDPNQPMRGGSMGPEI